MSVQEKLMPFQSLYTIGTFEDLIANVILPSINIMESEEKELCGMILDYIHSDYIYSVVDMLLQKFEITHMYLHVHDNYIRLLSYFSDDTVARFESMFKDQQDIVKHFQFVTDIWISPQTFNSFFERCESEDDFNFKALIEASDLMEELEKEDEQLTKIIKNNHQKKNQNKFKKDKPLKESVRAQLSQMKEETEKSIKEREKVAERRKVQFNKISTLLSMVSLIFILATFS